MVYSDFNHFYWLPGGSSENQSGDETISIVSKLSKPGKRPEYGFTKSIKVLTIGDYSGRRCAMEYSPNQFIKSIFLLCV